MLPAHQSGSHRGSGSKARLSICGLKTCPSQHLPMTEPGPTNADWAQVRALFEQLCRWTPPHSEGPAGRPGLAPGQAAEVRSLLQFVDETRVGLLGQGAAALPPRCLTTPGRTASASASAPGAWWSRWGAAAWARVWLAERADGARRPGRHQVVRAGAARRPRCWRALRWSGRRWRGSRRTSPACWTPGARRMASPIS